MNVSLRLLRAFVVVGQEGNVRRAAERLFVSEPSLSQDIRRLEREVGTVLFERGARGMRLTAAGEELSRTTELALGLLDRGVMQAQHVARTARQRLLLAFSPSVGNKFMPALLPVLERELLDADIDEREVDTGEVAPGVRDGRFDIGFAHCVLTEPGLVSSTICDEPLCVAISSERPEASRRSIQLAELEGMALLLWPRETAPEYFDRILAICNRAGLSPEVVTGARRAMIRSYMLSEGRLFALLPKSTAVLRLPEISFVTVTDTHAVVPLMYLRREFDERPAVAEVERIARALSGILTRSTKKQTPW